MAPRNLRTDLSRRMIGDDLECNKFFPEGSISSLLTEESIKEYMSEADQELIEFLSKKAKKVFGIVLVSCGLRGNGLVGPMKAFKQLGFTDDLLPVENLTKDNCRFQGGSQCSHKTALDIFHGEPLPFDFTDCENFYEKQWSFLAPIFAPEDLKLELDIKRVLPIEEREHAPRQGYFSDVWNVKIHRDHQTVIQNKDVRFAIKKLREITEQQTLEEAWTREANALDQARKLGHPHLISPIAAFKRCARSGDTMHNTYYFIFEWANMGTLRDYLDLPRPDLSADLIEEALREMYGLAGALCHLHNPPTDNSRDHHKSKSTAKSPNWRHGDLKPDNILRFGDTERDREKLGTLRITDLGLAKRHIKETALRQDPTTQKFGTRLYESPEANLTNGVPRSRRYDTWSMGCIILEFIIWLLHGKKGVQNFHDAKIDGQKDTLFYKTIGAETMSVSPIASSWMKELGKDCECKNGTALHELLQLVEEKLLVVELDRKTPKHRIDSKELCEALSKILQNPKKFSGKSRKNIEVPNPVPLSSLKRIGDQMDVRHPVEIKRESMLT